MSDSLDTDGEVFHIEDLWVVQFRENEDGPWIDFGTYKSSWKDQLRVYEYRVENFPEAQHQLVRAHIARSIEDPVKLREILNENPAGEDDPALQSE